MTPKGKKGPATADAASSNTVAQLRSELAATQRTRGDLEAQLSAVSADLAALKASDTQQKQRIEQLEKMGRRAQGQRKAVGRRSRRDGGAQLAAKHGGAVEGEAAQGKRRLDKEVGQEDGGGGQEDERAVGLGGPVAKDKVVARQADWFAGRTRRLEFTMLAPAEVAGLVSTSR